jgi:ubiquinone/menaquinone biosynthesis C-methylase UbiE
MDEDGRLLIRFLEKNLPAMATTFDEGLGIASERYSVNKVIKKIIENDKIEKVLEAPVDGLMGIPGMNSVIFARKGANVIVGSPSKKLLENAKNFWKKLELEKKVEFITVLDKFPFSENSFDLVWSYCMFEHFKDAEKLLDEMKRVSKKYVLLITQNAYNYGYPIHRLYHVVNRQAWDHGYTKWMKLGNLNDLFIKNGLIVKMKGCVDVPPWFDTFDMHTRGKIKFFLKEEKKKEWFWSALQEDDMKKLSENGLIKKLEHFEEKLTWPLNYFFAHHFFILGVK